MLFLPIRYKKIEAHCSKNEIIELIRMNSIYIYDSNGYVKQSVYNPNELLFRNESENTIYLKEKIFNRYGNPTTAIIFSQKDEGLFLKTISYSGIFGLFYDLSSLVISFVFSVIIILNPSIFENYLFLIFFGLLYTYNISSNNKEYNRHYTFINKVISTCNQKVGVNKSNKS